MAPWHWSLFCMYGVLRHFQPTKCLLMPFKDEQTQSSSQTNWSGFFFCSPKVIEMCLNNYYLSFTEMRVQHKENSVTIKLVDGTNGRRRFPNGDCFCLFLKTPQIIKRKICIYCFNAGHLLHIYF